jgi:tetratricopeptide (TPR) repeat protein
MLLPAAVMRHPFLPLCLVLALAVSAAHGQSLFDWFNLARKSKDPQQRIAYYTKALAAWTEANGLRNKAIVLANRGVEEMTLDQADAALADFNQAADLAPQLPFVYMKRATLCWVQGRFEAALDDYNRLIALDPKQSEPYALRAEVYQRLGRLDASDADLALALKIDSKSEEAYDDLGWLRIDQGKLDEAMDELKIAAALNSNYGDPELGMAAVELQRGHERQARVHWDKAIALEPTILGGPRALTKDSYTYSENGERLISQMLALWKNK